MANIATSEQDISSLLDYFVASAVYIRDLLYFTLLFLRCVKSDYSVNSQKSKCFYAILHKKYYLCIEYSIMCFNCFEKIYNIPVVCAGGIAVYRLRWQWCCLA